MNEYSPKLRLKEIFISLNLSTILKSHTTCNLTLKDEIVNKSTEEKSCFKDCRTQTFLCKDEIEKKNLFNIYFLEIYI